MTQHKKNTITRNYRNIFFKTCYLPKLMCEEKQLHPKCFLGSLPTVRRDWVRKKARMSWTPTKIYDSPNLYSVAFPSILVVHIRGNT